MSAWLGLLKSDLLKLKRTPFLLVHLLMPLLGIGLILAYYSQSLLSPADKALVYFQVLACAFPTLIGLVCSMAAEQEGAAGGFQGLLASPGPKISTYISKLLTLLLFSLGATLLAVIGFGLAFQYVLDQDGLGLFFYWIGVLILFGSNLPLYLLHLYLSLKFGRGSSIGMGITGSLIMALMLTGLGDGIWPYVPYSWGGRFTSLWTVYASGAALPSAADSGLYPAIAVCALAIALGFLLSCAWFHRWEGRSTDN